MKMKLNVVHNGVSFLVGDEVPEELKSEFVAKGFADPELKKAPEAKQPAPKKHEEKKGE